MTDTAVERAELTSQQRAALVRAANNGGVHPGGRPSDYCPSYCDVVVELGRAGKSQAQMAAELGVAKQRLTQWSGIHSEFADALALARTLSQRWWEDQAQGNLSDRDFNAGLWMKSVASRFRDDYTEKVINEQTGTVRIEWGKAE